MKPTDKQKKVITNILSTIKYWSNTNDITSPSHLTLIEEDMNSLADELDMEYDDNNIEELVSKLSDLYFVIRKFA